MKKQVQQQDRFQPKLKIKKGDTVKVLTGEDRGKTGEVMEVFPKENTAIVEGVRIVSKHTKPSAQNPNGGIIEKSAPIQISNLQVVVNGQPTRVGRKVEGEKIVRYSKKTQEVID
jgi:large subunit ribosomal protein L24